MNCGDARDRLGEWAVGALEARERQDLEAHIRACGECRAERDAFVRVESALRELAPRRRSGWRLVVAAAAAGLFSALLFAVVRPQAPRLADGCEAKVDAGSEVRLVSPRSVRVEHGGATFVVAPPGPFEVITPAGRVEVVGTEFWVRVEQEATMQTPVVVGAMAMAVTVGVVSGAVIFRRDGRDTRVGAGEMLRATGAQETKQRIASAEELKRLEGELADARAKIERLEAENAKLTKGATAPAAPPGTKPAEPDLTELWSRFDEYTEKALEMIQSPKLHKLIEELRDVGSPATEEMRRRLLEGKTSNERFLAGMVLEGLGDAAAIPSLAKSLKEEKDDLVRRMSSHALAMIGTKEVVGPLREAMIHDSDWGVRVNSSYGAARQGDDFGIRTLAGQYTSSDIPKAYKLAVFQAMAMVAHESYIPAFREALATEREMSALFIAIGGLEASKDARVIPDLERIVNSDQHPQTVRDAAAKAIANLRK